MKNTLLLITVMTLTAFVAMAESQVDSPSDNKAQILLSELRKDLTALQAEFKQYELTRDGRAVEENSGTVWMQTPDYFKWHYKEPFEQLIVADGEKVWVYDEDLQQVTAKTQNNNLNPIYVIINEELSTRYYNISYEGKKEGLNWVRLTPKKDSDEVKDVMLGIDGNQLHSIHVNNQMDQTLVFEFSKLKQNPQLPDNTFQFVPPDNVDVVEAIE